MTRDEFDAVISRLHKEGGLVWVGLDRPMTLRDYFAAKAMQVILHPANERIWDEKEIAEQAYSMADGMLAERAK